MANPGAGNRFVSVNLNKSYGQHSQNSYGSGRIRAHGHGGAGMAVLSRPRSSQKAGPKLSVPPLLNLPSSRKEHEKFDSLCSGGGPAEGGGGSGNGSRPMWTSMGWTKLATVALEEKELFAEQTLEGFDQGLRSVDGFSRGSSVYVPPSARSGMVAPISTQAHPTVEKVAVLRGDDFPSLRATLSSTSGLTHNLEQKYFSGENVSSEVKDASHLSSVVEHALSVRSVL